jgi:hypothetical protein
MNLCMTVAFFDFVRQINMHKLHIAKPRSAQNALSICQNICRFAM